MISSAALILMSCGRIDSFEGLYSRAKGEEIVFGVSSSNGAVFTKSTYSGEEIPSGGKSLERIDWVEGEKLSLACAKVENIKTFSYKVASVETDGTFSYAGITHDASDEGLRWGDDGDYYFYAQSPESTNLTVYGTTIFNLPKDQTGTGSWNSGNTKYTVAANPDYMHMTSYSVVTKNGSAPAPPVDLPFTMLPTVIEFTLSGEAGMTVKNIGLVSTQYLTGESHVDIASQARSTESPKPEYPECTITSSTPEFKEAWLSTMTAEGFPVEIAEGKSLTGTIFLNPCDISHLSFCITTKDGDADTYTTRKTSMKYVSGDWLKFDAHKKYRIKGVIVPDGVEWIINYDPTVQSWDKDDESINPLPEVGEKPFVTSWDSGMDENLDMQINYTYEFYLPDVTQSLQSFVNSSEPSQTKSIIINSTKTAEGGATTDANWTIKSYKIGSADPVAVGGTSFTDKGGLDVTKVGNNLQVNATARSAVYPGNHDYWVNQNPSRTDNLNWSPADWSGQGTIDLSKYDYSKDTPSEAIDAHAMTTANCYIIRHAGTYKIPLVYGNGVINGIENVKSYKPTISGSVYPMTPFVDHNNNGISSAYIENGTDCVPTGCAIVWQDEDVVVKDLAIIGATKSSYDASNVRYLQFTVDPAKIRQNNAVICIYKDSNGNGGYDSGEAVWSWHIWTTNNPDLLSDAIPVTNHIGNVYRFFPIYSIGHVDEYYYPARKKVIITLEQEESGNTIEITVNQPVVLGPSAGNYYQFGRKDPMCRKDNPAAGSFHKNGASLTWINIESVIKYPDTFFNCIDFFTTWEHYSWGWPYTNMWTGGKATINTSYENDSEIFKTIYDPSPVGYKMPASKAFTGFTTTGEGTYSQEAFNVINDFKCGYYFYTDATKSDVILFPASGYRHSESGNVNDKSLRGSYWSAVSGNESSGYQMLFFKSYDGSAGMAPANFERRANGQSVRPVLE